MPNPCHFQNYDRSMSQLSSGSERCSAAAPKSTDLYHATRDQNVNLQIVSPTQPRAKHSTLNTQHSTLNTQHSALNTQHSTLNIQHSLLDTQHSALNTQHSTLDTQQSTLDTRHSTLNNQHSTLNTRHSTRWRGRLAMRWPIRGTRSSAFRKSTPLHNCQLDIYY